MSGISLPDCDAKLVMIILPCNSRVIFFWGFFLGGGFGTPGGVGGMGAERLGVSARLGRRDAAGGRLYMPAFRQGL